MGEAGQGPDAYWEPSGPVGLDGRIEERIRRSCFIACLAPCRDEAGCRGFLNDIHAAHRDATHNCWAYLLGPHPTVEYCSDDGEPSGTAGRPILGAVRRSGMVNVMVVVTRYFGGVKLGVRGLIEAYGPAAERVLTAAERVERRVARRGPASLRLHRHGDAPSGGTRRRGHPGLELWNGRLRARLRPPVPLGGAIRGAGRAEGTGDARCLVRP